MVSLQRKVEVEGDGESKEFLCIATFLPVRSWRYVIPFFRLTGRVQKQLEHTKGLARYGLRMEPLSKKFWTFTVWKGKEFMESFVPAQPHNEAVTEFKEWAGEGAAFVEWTDTNGSIDWETGMEKLRNPTFYYKKT